LEISAGQKVVLIHYTLKDDDGGVIDSSAGRTAGLHSRTRQLLVEGLEKALEGKPDGSSVAVSVQPRRATASIDAKLIQRVPKALIAGLRRGQEGHAIPGTDPPRAWRLFTVTGVKWATW